MTDHKSTDGFADMIAATRTFMADLEHNNNRDWFEGKKAKFNSDIVTPLKFLIELFAEDLSRQTGAGHTGKMGRIYRDVRFSKDKSPYNTHVHAYWQQTGGAGPGWLLNLDAQGAHLMTGLHALDADGLARYRAAVDRDGDALQTALAKAESSGAALAEFGDATLKRVPKPFAADHPHAELLRRKQLILRVTLDEARLQSGVLTALNSAVRDMQPGWHWCDRAMR